MNDAARDEADNLVLMAGKLDRYMWPEPEPEPPVFEPQPPLPRITPLQQRTALRRLILDVVTHRPGRTKTALKTTLRGARLRFRDREANAVIEMLVLQGHIHIERSGNRALLYPRADS